MSNRTQRRNPLRNWSDERLVRAADMAEEELAHHLQARRENPVPNATRAGVIADLSAEFRLYCAELTHRGIE